MEMGLLDLPAPLLQWLDNALSALLPAGLRVALWALLSAGLSMLLYRLCSRQQTLAALKPQLAAARRELAAYDGDFAGLWPRIGAALRLSLRQLQLTFLPALAASVPVLLIIVWLSNAYGVSLPAPGAIVDIGADPRAAAETLRWQPQSAVRQAAKSAMKPGQWQIGWPAPGNPYQLLQSDDRPLMQLPVTEPAPLLHKKQWWNYLIANPAGYLPAHSPVEVITLDLPQTQLIGVGPAWLRGWEAVYFSLLILVSVLIKIVWRLH